MCTECIAFIDGKRDEALNKIKEEVKTEETQTSRAIPKPKEINDFLNQYVIGQEEAKKYLSLSGYNHYKLVMQPSND